LIIDFQAVATVVIFGLFVFFFVEIFVSHSLVYKHHTTALSFNYDAARKCFEQIREPMTKAIDYAPPESRKWYRKRDFEFFKLALYSRLDKMLDQAGVLNQVLEFTKTSRKFTGCQMHCLAKISPVGCQEKNHCGLNEPSDEAIVESMVQCSIQNGVNTEAIRNLCRCLAQAGNSIDDDEVEQTNRSAHRCQSS
ncbi:hypothetical protein COOONC_07505, partial [Cooperia oncophora]